MRFAHAEHAKGFCTRYVACCWYAPELQKFGEYELCSCRQAASASSGRELDRLGALASLNGRYNRYLVTRSAVSLGRATDTAQARLSLVLRMVAEADVEA